MVKLALLMRNYSGSEWSPATSEFLLPQVPLVQGGHHDSIGVGDQAVETPQSTSPTPATPTPGMQDHPNEREETDFGCHELKGLTPCRKKLVTEFLNEALKNPEKYHQAEGVTLLKKELIQKLRTEKSARSTKITSDELNDWLKETYFALLIKLIRETSQQSTASSLNMSAYEGNAANESTTATENAFMETEISSSSFQYSDVSTELDIVASIPVTVSPEGSSVMMEQEISNSSPQHSDASTEPDLVASTLATVSTEENSFIDKFDTDREVEIYSYPSQNTRKTTVFSNRRLKRLTPCRRVAMTEILNEALKSPRKYHQTEGVTLLKKELLQKLRMRKMGSAGVITSDDLNHWLKQSSFVSMIKSIMERRPQPTAAAVNMGAWKGNVVNESATKHALMESDSTSAFVKYIPTSTIPDVGARMPATVSTAGYKVMNQFDINYGMGNCPNPRDPRLCLPQSRFYSEPMTDTQPARLQ